MMYDKLMQDHSEQARRLIMAGGTEGADEAGEGALPLRTRSEVTVDAIKRYIIEHSLRAGEPLPTEARLCEDLGVSRTSVREALRRLEALDIVSSQQGKGSFVGGMSLGPMVETVVLRHALDAKAGRTALREVARTRQYLDIGMAQDLVAAMRGTENPELRGLVAKMVERVDRGETYMSEDIAFHEGLAAYLGNGLVSQLVRAMWLINQAVIPHLGPQLPEALRATAHTHSTMLDAAEAGDVEAFRRAVVEHYAPLESFIESESREGQRGR